MRQLQEFLRDNVSDPEDLVTMLEISVDDLLEKFPRKVVENAHKYGLPTELEDDDPYGLEDE